MDIMVFCAVGRHDTAAVIDACGCLLTIAGSVHHKYISDTRISQGADSGLICTCPCRGIIPCTKPFVRDIYNDIILVCIQQVFDFEPVVYCSVETVHIIKTSVVVHFEDTDKPSCLAP